MELELQSNVALSPEPQAAEDAAPQDHAVLPLMIERKLGPMARKETCAHIAFHCQAMAAFLSGPAARGEDASAVPIAVNL